MLAPTVSNGLLAGLDPSALMVQQTRRRLQSFATQVRLDIRQGTDREIRWPKGYFKHVAALHSFQFWPEPLATLADIRGVLCPDGQLTLILRSHSRRKPEWLPNPLSRCADEVARTMVALEQAGFDRVQPHPEAGSSAVITARAPLP